MFMLSPQEKVAAVILHLAPLLRPGARAEGLDADTGGLAGEGDQRPGQLPRQRAHAHRTLHLAQTGDLQQHQYMYMKE